MNNFASSARSVEVERIRSREAIVGVVGLGYVGLPLVDAFIKAGFKCIGFDVDAVKTRSLQQGVSYIKHIPDLQVASWLKEGRFEASNELGRLGEVDAILICVPTPLSESRDPDLSYVVSTAEAIAKTLRRGQLIVLESTTYPGTTKDVLVPVLESTGLVAGSEFFVAYSPEREDPGNPSFTANRIPKVVGGLNKASLELADALYSCAVVSTVPVASCEVAEACKILENTYRSVNIAMVNELKLLFAKLGIDIWEVIDAAKTKPFGFQAFYPGPGLGGHCIPIDPFYLSWLARKHELSTRFIELAGEVNSTMPNYVIGRIAEALNDRGKALRGSKVFVLGVAYKKDVDDARESPSLKLMQLLLDYGADVTYNDPYIPTLPSTRRYSLPGLSSMPVSASHLGSQDCVLIATNHTVYDYEQIVSCSQVIVDTRNATSSVVKNRDRIVKA